MTKKLMNKSTSLVIPLPIRYNMLMVTIGRCMMTRNLALLTISAALLGSLLLFDVGHAVQTEKKQEIRYLTLAEIKGTANAPTTHESNTLTPCTGDGLRRPGTACQTHSLFGSGEKSVDRILFVITALTATLIVTLVALILWVLLSRRIPPPPFVKSSTH
jgi:hypothetical protein